METNRSALTTFLRAHQLGSTIWKGHSHRFSRHDYTCAQLFACLVLREVLKMSYRRAEAFLKDVPDWLRQISLEHAPDHNTLWRAFGKWIKPKQVNRALDVLAAE